VARPGVAPPLSIALPCIHYVSDQCEFDVSTCSHACLLQRQRGWSCLFNALWRSSDLSADLCDWFLHGALCRVGV